MVNETTACSLFPNNFALDFSVVALSFFPICRMRHAHWCCHRLHFKKNLSFSGSSWEPTFWAPNQFIFGRHVQTDSKLGAGTGSEPVPCWWKRGMRVLEILIPQESSRLESEGYAHVDLKRGKERMQLMQMDGWKVVVRYGRGGKWRSTG